MRALEGSEVVVGVLRSRVALSTDQVQGRAMGVGTKVKMRTRNREPSLLHGSSSRILAVVQNTEAKGNATIQESVFLEERGLSGSSVDVPMRKGRQRTQTPWNRGC